MDADRECRRTWAFAIPVLVLAAAPTLAWDLGPGAYFTRETYPTEITLRPLTLPGGMVQGSFDASSVPSRPVGTNTYTVFSPHVRFGATDDIRLEAHATMSSCADCSSSFPQSGVGGGGSVRVSLARTNVQQLTADLGASQMNWRLGDATRTYSATLIHDVAAGPFALVTSASSLHGDRPWGLQVSLQPQFQLGSHLVVYAASSAIMLDSRRGLAASRNSIPLEVGLIGSVRRDHAGLIDLGAAYAWTNPFVTGPARARHALSAFGRVSF